VDMTRHDAPSVQIHSFVFNAIFPAVKHYRFVFLSDEDIDPVNDGICDKIKLVCITEFVLTAHFFAGKILVGERITMLF
jgi:hypothetical protein